MVDGIVGGTYNPNAITFYGASGAIVTFKSDGTIVIGDGYTPAEASDAFLAQAAIGFPQLLAVEAEACAACCLTGTVDEIHERILERARQHREGVRL